MTRSLLFVFALIINCSCKVDKSYPSYVEINSRYGGSVDTIILPAKYEYKFDAYPSDNDYEYLWDFGDGTTSNLISPRHKYAVNGIYKVNLKVKNDNGFGEANLIVNVCGIKVASETEYFTGLFVYQASDLSVYLIDMENDNYGDLYIRKIKDDIEVSKTKFGNPGGFISHDFIDIVDNGNCFILFGDGVGSKIGMDGNIIFRTGVPSFELFSVFESPSHDYSIVGRDYLSELKLLQVSHNGSFIGNKLLCNYSDNSMVGCSFARFVNGNEYLMLLTHCDNSTYPSISYTTLIKKDLNGDEKSNVVINDFNGSRIETTSTGFLVSGISKDNSNHYILNIAKFDSNMVKQWDRKYDFGDSGYSPTVRYLNLSFLELHDRYIFSYNNQIMFLDFNGNMVKSLDLLDIESEIAGMAKSKDGFLVLFNLLPDYFRGQNNMPASLIMELDGNGKLVE